MKMSKWGTDVGKIGDFKLPLTKPDGSKLLAISLVTGSGPAAVGTFEEPETVQECLQRSKDEAAVVSAFNTGSRLDYNRVGRAAMIFKITQNGGLAKLKQPGVTYADVSAEIEEAEAFALDVVKNRLTGEPIPEEFGGEGRAKSPFDKMVTTVLTANPGMPREDAVAKVKAAAPALGIDVPEGV